MTRRCFLVGALAAVACHAEGPTNGTTTDSSTVPVTEPPTLQVGYDAYRQWSHLPDVRIGMRTYMRSTYDRSGGNEAADASHYLREDAPGRDIALDVAGLGVLSFFRANRWHGSPWLFGIDGATSSVSESATATPDDPPATSTFFPAASFPPPLALTYATTQGGDVSWVPMGFTESLTIAHTHSHYGTGYFIYSTYDPGASLSQPISAWSSTANVPSDLPQLLSRPPELPSGVATRSGRLDVPSGGATTFATLSGPGRVRLLRLTVDAAASPALQSARIRITWDGRAEASVDAPVPLFFGTGTFYNRSNASALVDSFPMSVEFHEGAVALTTYFPMPFFRTATFEIVTGTVAVPGLAWQISTDSDPGPANAVGLFHATAVDHGTPAVGQDLVFLDTTRTEGGGDWCGTFVGTSFTFSDQANLGTLEGDPRFFFDDSMTPQGQGTGTEEWGAGGDYWNGGVTTTLPLAGHPVGAPSLAAAVSADDAIESAYRFLVADAFPFGRNATIRFEHGGTNESTEHYRSVTYWYGTPSACLVLTDTLHVSDAADEAVHAYRSDATTVDTMTSRYEWGVDHMGTQEIYPATIDSGRHSQGAIDFVVRIDPSNLGVLLRRKLDYSFPDQRAVVYVGDVGASSMTGVAVWYLAGSNTCAFVDAPTETGVVVPDVETSNRRWRGDELLLPRAAVAGKSRVHIRIVPEGGPWSEFRYSVYSYRMPSP